MPDHYFIYAGDRIVVTAKSARQTVDKHMIRCIDGRVLFNAHKFETGLAQDICDELNTCRDASTAR